MDIDHLMISLATYHCVVCYSPMFLDIDFKFLHVTNFDGVFLSLTLCHCVLANKYDA